MKYHPSTSHHCESQWETFCLCLRFSVPFIIIIILFLTGCLLYVIHSLRLIAKPGFYSHNKFSACFLFPSVCGLLHYQFTLFCLLKSPSDTSFLVNIYDRIQHTTVDDSQIHSRNTRWPRDTEKKTDEKKFWFRYSFGETVDLPYGIVTQLKKYRTRWIRKKDQTKNVNVIPTPNNKFVHKLIFLFCFARIFN